MHIGSPPVIIDGFPSLLEFTIFKRSKFEALKQCSILYILDEKILIHKVDLPLYGARIYNHAWIHVVLLILSLCRLNWSLVEDLRVVYLSQMWKQLCELGLHAQPHT